MILYHGSDVIVSAPGVEYSTRNLDFGKGFYTTSIKEQAVRWAQRKALINKAKCGFVSVFEANISSDLKVLDLTNNLDEWIDFVCECRDGSQVFSSYDVIIGKVADDKVFKVVDMYKNEIWNKARALSEMKIYETCDQIMFATQNAIDSSLVFKENLEVEL